MPVMRRVLSALVLPAVLASTSVLAAAVDGFYRVEIPQAEDVARDEVIREGARVMFERLAGEEVDLTSGVIGQAMQDPRSLMRRIANTDQGTIAMEFEPALLRDVLANAGSPMLGRNRPGVLVWAVDAQPLGDELVAQGSSWAETLRRAAQYRAVPVSFPLGDLEDRGRVSEASIRKADDDSLSAASERYAPEGVLAIGANADDEQAKLNWTFWLNQREYSGKVEAADPQKAADELMQDVASAIFEQYSIPAASDSDQNRWTIVVNEVETLDEFAGVQRMVQQLGARSAPQLLSVAGDQVTFELAFPGDEAQLERMLGLDHRMQRSSAPPPAPEQPAAAPASEPALTPAQGPESTDATEPGVDAQAVPPSDSSDQSAGVGITEPSPQGEGANGVARLPEPVTQPAPNTLYYRWR